MIVAILMSEGKHVLNLKNNSADELLNIVAVLSNFLAKTCAVKVYFYVCFYVCLLHVFLRLFFNGVFLMACQCSSSLPKINNKARSKLSMFN